MQLRKIERRQDPDIVSVLEEILARARAGEVTGLVLVAQDACGVEYRVVGIRNRWEKIGLLSHAIHKLQDDE